MVVVGSSLAHLLISALPLLPFETEFETSPAKVGDTNS